LPELAGLSQNKQSFCGMSLLCRQYTVLFKCVYDRLKDKCNATSSAIYTRYHTIVLERVGCGISKYKQFILVR